MVKLLGRWGVICIHSFLQGTISITIVTGYTIWKRKNSRFYLHYPFQDVIALATTVPYFVTWVAKLLSMFCIGSVEHNEPTYNHLWPVFVIIFRPTVHYYIHPNTTHPLAIVMLPSAITAPQWTMVISQCHKANRSILLPYILSQKMTYCAHSEVMLKQRGGSKMFAKKYVQVLVKCFLDRWDED